MENKFQIQNEQYGFPYHHLVRFDRFSNYIVMPWGFEYYAYMTKVIALVVGIGPKSLLDIGCGEGKMILELSKILPGKMMHGVDLSERAIFFAKAFNYGNESIFECRDVAGLTSTYDVITLVETIEHIPDEDIHDFIATVAKRLNKGGRVVVSVPSLNFPVIPKHYRHYNLNLIAKQFSEFEIESSNYYVHHGFLYSILIRFSRKFCSFKFAQSILFKIAQKFVFDATDTTGRHIVCVLKKHE